MQFTSALLKRLIPALLICTGLWAVSQWWETALAKRSGFSDVSPNGCYRVEEFEPFWILPGFFHPQAHPDEEAEVHWFIRWEAPAFFRVYDNHSGKMLGQSKIYDLVADGDRLYWGDNNVSAGMIEIGTNLPDCTHDQKR